MEIQISGLKCDHCNYRDDSVQFSDYESSIGRPCPECGHSLLTQEDYDKCMKLLKYNEILNKLANVFKWINPLYYIRLITGKPVFKRYDVTVVSHHNKPDDVFIKEHEY